MAHLTRLLLIGLGEAVLVALGWVGGRASVPPPPLPEPLADCPTVDEAAVAAREAELRGLLGRPERRWEEARRESADKLGLVDPAAEVVSTYTPDWSAPAVMEARVTRLFDACHPPADLLGFACQDEVCLATVVGDEGWERELRACPGWVEWEAGYGTSVTSVDGEARCADGSTVELTLWGPAGQSDVEAEIDCSLLDESECERRWQAHDEAMFAWLRGLRERAGEAAAAACEDSLAP